MNPQPEAGPSTRHRPPPLVLHSPFTPNARTPTAATITTFPSVERRVAHSTKVWARDLRSLFEHARDRFADVSWESEEGGNRVWGHKAVIYARAPKAFKDRYFISKPFSRSPTSLRSPSPHVLPPLFTNHSRPPSPPSSYLTPSPYAGGSSTLTVNTFTSERTARQNGHDRSDGVLRLTHGDTPEMFQAQLEWLYTGEGFGDVVEWISNDTTIGTGVGSIRDSLGRRGDVNERRDKLGQDLAYMWRSKLYADVRIHLEMDDGSQSGSEDSDDSADSLSSTTVFTAHKAILASRSPYFSNVLLNTANFFPTSTDNVHLPTPPFTPAALHFCLGYMYAGHLDFSNRTFDLATAFQIHRAALYLQLDALSDEVESRLVHDFCHSLDKRKCKCRKCPLRAARVWRFASASDVGAVDLARVTRAYVVSAWGDSWGKEIGMADEADRRALVMDVSSTVTHKTVISAFRSIASIKQRIETGIRARGPDASPWVDNLETMIEAVQAQARRVLLAEWSDFVEATELWDLINGKGFDDDLLDTVGKELSQVLGTSQGCVEGPRVYQALVSSVLLKVDPDTLQTVVPPRGRARQQVEGVKEGVLVQIKRRWMQVRDGGGFDGVDNWALKEISDEIEVPVDDLLSTVDLTLPVSSPVKAKFTPATSPKASPRRPIPAVAQRAVSGVHSRPSRASLTSSAPRTNGHRSNTARPPSPPDSSGLRRLRLSSSASSASMVSSRSTAPSAAPPSRPAELEYGPRARSPTAETQGPIVSIGAGRRSRLSNQSSTPTPPPLPRSMSGPPRQLLTRDKVTATPERTRVSRTASPGPAPSVTSASSVRTTRTARASGSSTLAPPLPINATRPIGTSSENNPRPSRLKSAASSTSLASTRQPSITDRKAKQKDVSPRTAGKGKVKEMSPKTVGRAGAAAAGKVLVTDTTKGRKAADSFSASDSRTRTGSMSTTTSVQSRLSAVSKAPTTAGGACPPLPSRPLISTATGKAPATGTAKSAPGAKPAAAATAPRTSGAASKTSPALCTDKASALRKSASVGSLASRTTVASRAAASRPPPVPKVPLKPTAASKTPVSSPPRPIRARNPSTASARRATRPANLGPTTFPPSLPPQPALDSASTSTTDDTRVQVRTPQTSSRRYIPSPKIANGGSESVPTTASSTIFHPASLATPRTSRKTSAASAVSVASARHHLHPASAFDPPKRRDEERMAVLSKERPVPAGLEPFKGRGVQFNAGIPCIVSLNARRARFRAAIKYIGHLDNSRGAWVGLECDDLERFGVATLPNGVIGTTHYFHLSDPVDVTHSTYDANRLARAHKVEAIRESLRNGRHASRAGGGVELRIGLGHGLGLGQEGMAGRSLSPFVEPQVGFEHPRALFVRPSEIVYVMGAE